MNPPCAFTTDVCVSSSTFLPSRAVARTTTGICSMTRSLRRRFTGLGALTLTFDLDWAEAHYTSHQAEERKSPPQPCAIVHGRAAPPAAQMSLGTSFSA